MYNKVILIGNLGKEPEIRSFDNGSKVAKFSLATNENYQDKNGEWQTNTEWHNVVAWRGLAEQAERLFKKGSMVFVEGKVTYRKWEDNEGRDRYTTDIVANYLRLLDKRESSSAGYSSFPSAGDEPSFISKSGAPAATVKTLTTDSPSPIEDTPMEEDDLPF